MLIKDDKQGNEKFAEFSDDEVQGVKDLVSNFEKSFDRLFKLYSEAKDSYWLAQLGELCLSLKLDIYVNKIVQFMSDEDEQDFSDDEKEAIARSKHKNRKKES